MLSPMIAATAAITITHSIEYVPCDAATAAMTSAVSPGSGRPAVSRAIARKTMSNP